MGAAAQYEAGNPAAAWISRVWREGSILKADFADVLPAVANWIRAKIFRKVSAEIDRPPEGETHPDLGTVGPVLKAVALLGANPPAVKGLADIPDPMHEAVEGVEIFAAGTFHKGTPDEVTFSEKDLDAIAKNFSELKGRYQPYAKIGTSDPHKGPALHFSQTTRNRLTLFCFAEVNTMDRQQMIDALKAAGINPDVIIAAVPDEQLDAVLAEILKGVKPPEQPPADAAMSQGQQTPGQPKKVQWSFTEADIKAAIAPYVADLENIKSTIKTTAELTAERLKAEHRVKAFTFCEDRVKRGLMTPAEMECDQAGEPLPQTALGRMLRASTVKTYTFSEGGKTVQISELDLQMAEIDKRTPHTFSEKMRGGDSKKADIYKIMRDRGAAARTGQVQVKTLEQRMRMLPAPGMR